jgi:hypothetical protein
MAATKGRNVIANPPRMERGNLVQSEIATGFALAMTTRDVGIFARKKDSDGY